MKPALACRVRITGGSLAVAVHDGIEPITGSCGRRRFETSRLLVCVHLSSRAFQTPEPSPDGI